MRPVTTGGVPISRSNIKQPIQFQSVHRRPQKRRVTSKGIHINEIKELFLQVALRHDPVRIKMRHHPSPLVPQSPRNHSREILRNDPPVLIVCVICPDEIGFGPNEVPERPDPATAQCIENPQLAFGLLVKRGGEHAEVSASGTLVAEEGFAGLEFETPLGRKLGVENRVGS